MSREQEKKCYGPEILSWLRANRTHGGRSESPYTFVRALVAGSVICCNAESRRREEGGGGQEMCVIWTMKYLESVDIQCLEHRRGPAGILPGHYVV